MLPSFVSAGDTLPCNLQGLQYAQSAVYCQHNCQQLMLCACHAVHALLLTSNRSGTQDKVAKKFAELLSEAVETVAMFSEPGWLLRLEGHVDDVTQMRKLHAELAQLAGIAGEAGIQTLPGAAGIAGVQASRSFRSQYSQPDSIGGLQEEVTQPDWRDDTDVLRGRLLELGGVAGLQTDTDCLLLKDLCRPGLEDVAFLELVDSELQVRLCCLYSYTFCQCVGRELSLSLVSVRAWSAADTLTGGLCWRVLSMIAPAICFDVYIKSFKQTRKPGIHVEYIFQHTHLLMTKPF